MKTLHDIAAPLLKKHKGNVEKTLPEFVRAVKAGNLIDDLARVFLRTVTIERHGSGQAEHETHVDLAGPVPPVIIKQGQGGSIKVREHPVRRHRRRTHEEKQAAERAMLASAEAVFELQIGGRAIGSMAIGEMAALKRRLFDDAADGIKLHIIDVRNAIIADQIERHCIAQDQLTPVREIIDTKTLTRFISNAERVAPRVTEEFVHRAREAMERTEIREIAS
jgi:hypothetical protein